MRTANPMAKRLMPPTPMATGFSQLLFLFQNVSLAGGGSVVSVVVGVVATALDCSATLVCSSPEVSGKELLLLASDE